MEGKRWRARQAVLPPSRRHLGSGEIRTEERERAETHRYVTMAATSSYMSEQRYVTRKPLFSDQQHNSILKKCRPAELSEEEHPAAKSDGALTKMEQISGSFSLSHSDTESRENLDSLLNISELREQRDFKEPTSPFCASSPVSGWSPPLRPQLTSTVLNPTYTPCSGRSRRLTESRRGRSEGQNTSYFRLSKGDAESPHQENYWACAIPRTPPPASHRQSSSWDPNRAYEALLDYSYPLRPGLGVSEWDTSGLQEDSHLQDSGIGLDRVDSSVSLSGLHCSASGDNQRSPDLQGFRSSGGRSLPDPVASSLDSLDCSEDKGGWRHDSCAPLCSFTSTRLLPQSRCVCREVDEEFWALPDHLEVLQLLSTQVREVTAKVSPPRIGSWESVGPSSFPLLGSETEGVGAAEDKRQRHGGNKARTEQAGGTLTAAAGAAAAAGAGGGESPLKPPSVPPAADLRGLGSAGARQQPAAGALTGPGGLELEALGQRGSRERQDQSDSLMQHIQVFCSHLTLLIQHLYALSERMQRLSAPSVDIDSVKSALADYQSFQSEVSSQQPLSDCVLHTGQLLLHCINTASPMLRDTLRLIERQSGELQSHTHLFLSSILSAMDSILQSREDAVELLQSH